MRTLNKDILNRMKQYITEYQSENGKSPSYRNIMNTLCMGSPSRVHRYVLALEREGSISRTPFGNIETPTQLDTGETTLVPLLGDIACGEPRFEVEHIEDSFELPRSLFGNGKLFMLHASGDSMIDIGINDGDLIVVRQQEDAEDGDIVVALTNNNNTLKRFYHRNGKVVLHPENKTMDDIIVDNCQIQGVLVGCKKKY